MFFTQTGPGGKNKIEEADIFEPNAAFKAPKIRFAIPMASLENATSLKARVEEDRSHAIEACAVKKKIENAAAPSRLVQ